ncbi:DUF2061 domain-containing protein [Comamonas aquatica]|uniref:DUF2061 domain-containing protein n=1 Tax=Comamonas aquatica TaxID=225991 RepID=A0AA42W4X8_9BURK|nr:DUF2061 domain-containing protein [Comamonas aquatica]MDH0381642.1 DUF2061 domain-containing protein [Comamonas aquatica]MDH0429787.1 DUF2061 domain-containing protein [Comamonas aquatica]MDH0940453.1 DUF2061 domain-containing protein [Comamonas aquatica]MDH1430340.1 DUF2061 domain-containing protein [Comamonas aquatica]MDH1604192.1 DUF2061 domain-containing protein [Comamonas aquatica]
MARYRTLMKTVSYYGVHLVVAAGVAYAVTGDWVAALTLSLLEPTVQMLFFYLHETLWERQAQRRPSVAVPCAAAAAGSQLPVCGHRSELQHSA